MGLRGIGAVPLSKRRAAAEAVEDLAVPAWVPPWSLPDLSRSERVIVFLECLTVTSGELAGTKFKVRGWQREFIERVYTPNADGLRAVRTAVLSMGRKNGKTQLASALALCHLCGPEAEPRGEVYSCANDRFQAAKIFNEMVALINAFPEISLRLNIVRFLKQIEDLETGSLYAALSSEAKTKMGLSPSFVIYDELGSSPDRHLYDAMDSAMGARKEPLLLVISTQAADDNATMSQLVDYGIRVNDGDIIDPAFHLTLHTASLDANPWSLEAWKAANPALDDFRSLSDVERQAQQAQRMPGQENSFRNLILNQRVAAHTKFIERSVWQACGGDAEIPFGARVYAGLDLGLTRDMSALVLVHQDIDGVFHVQPRFWLPGDLRERSDSDRAPYEVWERDGLLIASGATTDPAVLAHAIAEASQDYQLVSVAFDRWRINEIQRELEIIGCDVALVPHGQGFKDMSPAVNVVERLIIEKRIRHGNNPILMANVANAVVTRDPAGGRKLDKAKSTGRIDGLVALAMALSSCLIMKGPEEIDVSAMCG